MNAFDALNRLPATPQETAWLQARMETLSVRESLILGAAETETLWGPDVRAAREARFNAVLERGEEDTFDAMLIKLVLAKDIAAPDIRARAALDTPPDSEPSAN